MKKRFDIVMPASTMLLSQDAGRSKIRQENLAIKDVAKGPIRKIHI
jgi:hypothetical protein